jgi:leader peptidase (prepilin peptidase)/N-methyltransferase
MSPTIEAFQVTAFAVPVIFIFGTAIGSFLNVLIWRLPRDEKPNGRSKCPHCKHELVWHDLIPVISFVVSRGKCKYCGKPISYRYPAIELVTGALFALAAWSIPLVDVGSWLVLAKVAVVIAVCVTVFVIDLEHYLILDKVVFPSSAIILGLLILTDVVAGTTSNTTQGILAALAASVPFLLLWFISKGKWMGLGDVKFMVFMGLALGFPGVLVALFVSFIVGAIVGVFLILAGKKQLSSKLPFGTFLSVATIVAVLYGNELWRLYWSLFAI